MRVLVPLQAYERPTAGSKSDVPRAEVTLRCVCVARSNSGCLLDKAAPSLQPWLKASGVQDQNHQPETILRPPKPRDREARREDSDSRCLANPHAHTTPLRDGTTE